MLTTKLIYYWDMCHIKLKKKKNKWKIQGAVRIVRLPASCGKNGERSGYSFDSVQKTDVGAG